MLQPANDPAENEAPRNIKKKDQGAARQAAAVSLQASVSKPSTSMNSFKTSVIFFVHMI
jgi:hypothetical protein